MKWVIALLFSIGALSSASGEDRAEFACGTNINGGSFFSDTGSVKCNGQSEVSADPKSQQVFCFYQATCLPATASLKSFVESRFPGKKWNQLKDDEINRTVINATMMGSLSFYPQFVPMAVQCLGTKSEDGTPNCPKVNSCVNNRDMSGTFWKLQPLKVPDPTKAPADNSDGFRVEQFGTSVPRGVSR
jgi:hypothetical protein